MTWIGYNEVGGPIFAVEIVLHALRKFVSFFLHPSPARQTDHVKRPLNQGPDGFIAATNK